MKKIVLTGGGTAGHVTPNLALIPELVKEGWSVSYIGAHDGIEKTLIEKIGVDYYGVSTGKLRRYFSTKNFTDMFRVVGGVKEAASLIHKLRPDVVFSKGGFVAVPVVLGAKMNGVPVIIHESDITPGLANKIAIPFAKKVCTTFPETLQYIPTKKGINTGTPIRKELFLGDEKKGLEICGFNRQKPILMMMGGSLGSVKINTDLRKALPKILKDFQLIHICGKGNLDKSLDSMDGYKQFEYLSEELPHIFAIAEIVISRAGSNSISEFLALKKPNLLIPLSAKASRGDQILNAESFEKQGFSMVLREEDMNPETILQGIEVLYEKREMFIERMNQSHLSDGVKAVMNVIRNYK
ncbi:MAG: undecaprenyldiphospho-muramoylpentapeptide beta-N-acetylglucosaminyltransferase [Clostridiales bacterium]|nr:undecaprenyldiphospho-muramoylpentapeptide beta-N-acetylglucosaminyltransferase [Clostridiales bacterium]